MIHLGTPIARGSVEPHCAENAGQS